MFYEVMACLDGSQLAEQILPLARGITGAKGGKLVLLRVVQEPAELSAEEEYWRDCARQYGAELRYIVSADPAQAIAAELQRSPRAVAALTTHGRTAWAEAILGSVALGVIRESKRPVLVYRPRGNGSDAPKKISTMAVALDGSAFSETIVPYGAKAAQFLSARLLLLQALPVRPPAAAASRVQPSDVLESSYLHRKAADIKSAFGIEAEWEVLHGDAGDALCRYLNDMPDTILAMTTHARGGIERAVLGSVAGYCVRHAGCPLFLYWPPRNTSFGKLGSGAVSSNFP